MTETVKAPPTPAPAPTPAAAPMKKTVEAWSAQVKPSAWAHVAAKAMYRWPIGAELTEAEYRAAIESALRIRIK